MKSVIIIVIVCLLACLAGQAQTYKPIHDKQLSNAIKKLECQTPGEQEPVTLNAALVKGNRSGEMTVVIKARTAQGWHMYAYVPPEEPFITAECILNLPEGVTAEGDWNKTTPKVSATDKGVLIWEKEAIFTHRIKAGQNCKGIIEAGLYYQTCNYRMCLPPAEKMIKLDL